MMVIDSKGHKWTSAGEQSHPFMTRWQCIDCLQYTSTYDDMTPAEEPELDKDCVRPQDTQT